MCVAMPEPAEDITLAPPQGAVWGDDSMDDLPELIDWDDLTDDDMPALVSPNAKFTLMWPDGAVIGEFSGDSIEKFAEELEYGLIPGVVQKRDLIVTYGEDYMIGSYYLLWGATELDRSRSVTGPEYCMSLDGAELTLNVRWQHWSPEFGFQHWWRPWF